MLRPAQIQRPAQPLRQLRHEAERAPVATRTHPVEDHLVERDTPRLIEAAVQGGITLHWNRTTAPHYCIYSGSPQDGVINRFEAAVTDTFVTLNYVPENLRLFEVRLCDGAPAFARKNPENELTKPEKMPR